MDCQGFIGADYLLCFGWSPAGGSGADSELHIFLDGRPDADTPQPKQTTLNPLTVSHPLGEDEDITVAHGSRIEGHGSCVPYGKKYRFARAARLRMPMFVGPRGLADKPPYAPPPPLVAIEWPRKAHIFLPDLCEKRWVHIAGIATHPGCRTFLICLAPDGDAGWQSLPMCPLSRGAFFGDVCDAMCMISSFPVFCSFVTPLSYEYEYRGFRFL